MYPMLTFDIAWCTGFSGVVALILLEINAIGLALNTISLTEQDVRVAAENYAIAAVSMG